MPSYVGLFAVRVRSRNNCIPVRPARRCSTGSPEILLTFANSGLRQTVRLCGRCVLVHRHRNSIREVTVDFIYAKTKYQAVWPPGSADTVCPRPPLTLKFDRLTLKLVCESHLRWGTFLPNSGTLSLWVLELFATDKETDRQTDGRTDGQKQRLLPLPYGRGHNT